MAIIASGPSAKASDIAALRGRAKIIAIKQSVDLCPWADMVYGCDAPWWRFRRGLPEFKGLKVSFDGNRMPEYPDLKYLKIASGKGTIYSDDIQFDHVGTVGAGSNSGFQAINAAAQFGGEPIILIGFDMHDCGGKHWYGRNSWPMANNPDKYNFQRWVAALTRAAPVLASRGISVFNTSRESALTCFPYRTVEQALADFDTSRQLDMAGVRSA